MKNIGFIGLGRMGTPMATNLIKAGYSLNVYNRTPKCSPLKDLGANFVDSPAEVVQKSEITITMLSDNQAVETVVFSRGGILDGIEPGKIIIDMSTISPEVAEKVALAIEEEGADILDAPVAGSVKPATEGTLVIMVGGKREVFNKCQDLLTHMGKKVVYVGGHGMGLMAKLAVNTLLGLTTQALAESVSLARKSGVKTEDMLEIISSSAVGSSPYIQTKVPLIKEGSYPAAFRLDHIHKDLGFALAEAHKKGVAMPSTAAAYEMFGGAKAKGMGGEDLMAVIKIIELLSDIK